MDRISHGLRAALCLAFPLLAGCGAEIFDAQLRAAGAAELACDAKKLTVEPISREHGGFEVSGCGKKAQFDCNRAWSKGRVNNLCYSAPVKPIDAARWEVSYPMECEVDDLTVKVAPGQAGKELDPNEPFEPHEHLNFLATGCGKKQYVTCMYRQVPPWADCYLSKPDKPAAKDKPDAKDTKDKPAAKDKPDAKDTKDKPEKR